MKAVIFMQIIFLLIYLTEISGFKKKNIQSKLSKNSNTEFTIPLISESAVNALNLKLPPPTLPENVFYNNIDCVINEGGSTISKSDIMKKLLPPGNTIQYLNTYSDLNTIPVKLIVNLSNFRALLLDGSELLRINLSDIITVGLSRYDLSCFEIIDNLAVVYKFCDGVGYSEMKSGNWVRAIQKFKNQCLNNNNFGILKSESMTANSEHYHHKAYSGEEIDDGYSNGKDKGTHDNYMGVGKVRNSSKNISGLVDEVEGKVKRNRRYINKFIKNAENLMNQLAKMTEQNKQEYQKIKNNINEFSNLKASLIKMGKNQNKKQSSLNSKNNNENEIQQNNERSDVNTNNAESKFKHKYLSNDINMDNQNNYSDDLQNNNNSYNNGMNINRNTINDKNNLQTRRSRIKSGKFFNHNQQDPYSETDIQNEKDNNNYKSNDQYYPSKKIGNIYSYPTISKNYKTNQKKKYETPEIRRSTADVVTVC